MMKSMVLSIICLLSMAVTGSARPGNHFMPVAVLYTGQDNQTHFKDEIWEFKDFGIGQEARQTAFREADSIGVLRLEAGSFFDWHPAPRKQFVLVVSGRVEIKAGDGEQRIFEAGKILLAADNLGRGHQTRPLNHQPAVIICIAVP